MMSAAGDAARLVALIFFINLICAGHVEGNGAVSLEGSDDSLCRPQQANTHLCSCFISAHGSSSHCL